MSTGSHVKWIATVSRPYIGLIHSRSAATVRISQTCRTGWMRPASERIASIAAAACSRGSRNSDCSSAPLLGVKPMRKCGSRSCHGPGRPSCGVQLTASSSMIGWRSTVAGRAPNSSSRTSPRAFTHTWSTRSRQRVNTLTLSPLAVIASKCSSSASHARSSNTRWRIA